MVPYLKVDAYSSRKIGLRFNLDIVSKWRNEHIESRLDRLEHHYRAWVVQKVTGSNPSPIFSLFMFTIRCNRSLIRAVIFTLSFPHRSKAYKESNYLY